MPSLFFTLQSSQTRFNLNVDTGVADYRLKFTLADCCFMSRKNNLDALSHKVF